MKALAAFFVFCGVAAFVFGAAGAGAALTVGLILAVISVERALR